MKSLLHNKANQHTLTRKRKERATVNTYYGMYEDTLDFQSHYQQVTATVTRKSFNVKFIAKIPIGHFMLPLLMLKLEV